MAILSLSSSIEAGLATLFVLSLVLLALRWDYKRLCRRIEAERDEGIENWSWPAYKPARNIDLPPRKEADKEWRPGNPERHAGPSSRSDRLPYGRKP